jgi:hypothetical protein
MGDFQLPIANFQFHGLASTGGSQIIGNRRWAIGSWKSKKNTRRGVRPGGRKHRTGTA